MKYLFLTTLLFTSSLYATPNQVKTNHRIDCITLDNDYRPDGGKFSIVSAKTKPGQARFAEMKQVPYLRNLSLQNFNYTVCKARKGNPRTSYDICGFTLEDDLNGQSIKINTGFNIDEDACSIQPPNGFIHEIRSFLIKDFDENARLQTERADGKVGHIFINDGTAQRRIVRIQCGSQSDNSMVIEGANR